METTPLFSILINLFPFALLAAAAYGIIKYIKYLRRPDRIKPKALYTIPSTVCIVIAAVSWIMNMGWLRVFLTWFPIPILHTIFFKLVNIRVAKWVRLNGATLKTKLLSALSCASYLLAYLLFPDVGDVGTGYMFFGLIHDSRVEAFIPIAIIFFVANIAVMIIQFINTKQSEENIKIESNEQIKNIK